MTEREDGWYWVKQDDGNLFGRPTWEVAYYWKPLGFTRGADVLKYVIEVGPRIPTPDEPWKTMPVNPTDGMLRHGAHAMRTNCKNPQEVYIAMLCHAPSPDDHDA